MLKKRFVQLAATLVLTIAASGLSVSAQDTQGDDLLKQALENIPQSAEFTISLTISGETEEGPGSSTVTGSGLFVTSPDPGVYTLYSGDGVEPAFEVVRTPYLASVRGVDLQDTVEMEFDETYIQQFYDPLNFNGMVGSMEFVGEDYINDTPAFLLAAKPQEDEAGMTMIELWLSQETLYPLRIHVLDQRDVATMEVVHDFYNWNGVVELPQIVGDLKPGFARLGTEAAGSAFAAQRCNTISPRVVDNYFWFIITSRTYRLNACEANNAANSLAVSDVNGVRTNICTGLPYSYIRNECNWMTATMQGHDNWQRYNQWFYWNYRGALNWAASTSSGANILHVFWLTGYPTIYQLR
jgi:hypothetical protein